MADFGVSDLVLNELRRLGICPGFPQPLGHRPRPAPRCWRDEWDYLDDEQLRRYIIGKTNEPDEPLAPAPATESVLEERLAQLESEVRTLYQTGTRRAEPRDTFRGVDLDDEP